MNIFVSYTTRDYYINKILLVNALEIIENYGNCYIDLLHNKSKDKQKHVELMLSQADLLLLISSDSISESKWVQWELNEAKKRGTPILVVEAKNEKSQTLRNLKLALTSNAHLLANPIVQNNQNSPLKPMVL
ncbi:TIR domain-containing protein [Citrobacter freundii]|nr:TIR domain-containing protein [Citrobacter freundii]